jgi:hypothetical protein
MTPGSPENWEALHTGLSADHLIALGHVAYWAARVDTLVPQIASSLLSDKDTVDGFGNPHGMRFSDVFKMTTRLMRELDPTSQAAVLFERQREKVAAAMEERNKLLHAYWLRGPTEPAIAQLTRKGHTEQRPVTTRQVEEVAVILALASDQLFLVYALLEGIMDYYVDVPGPEA